MRASRGVQALAAMRNVAIGLPRLVGETNIAAACRRYQTQPARTRRGGDHLMTM